MRGSFSWRSWRGTNNFYTAPGLPMPSRPLLFLYCLARVHQEDRSSNLARSRPLLKNVLSKYTPKDVLSKCTPKNVLAKCMVKLVLQASSLLTSSHSGQACYVISCTTKQSRAPLVHHRLQSYHSRAMLSCTTHKLLQLSWHFPLPDRRNFYS